MSLYDRENQYINILANSPHTVKELAEKLFISEPTVRRDIVSLQKKDLLTCKRGLVTLKTNSPDRRIPLFIRNLEQNDEKKAIAIKAISHIKDGFTIMLDASTTALHIIPYLTNFKNIIVITNGVKTALESASMGIKTISKGGEITLESFCYVGADAEMVLRRYNADITFFSCRGLTDDGLATDTSVLENSIRRIMIKNSSQSFLLCDKSKLGNKYLNTLCNVKELSGVISNI
ncbi:MAG: DeoR/GlpR transcriptional regulator [Clostridia bacterium]|nr:DeoR/GlpR transcriptional regulator [Clostridia bacterium]